MSGNPDSGIGKFFVEPRGPSGIRKYFARGIQNPGLWNPEYSSRNPKYHERIGIRNPSSPDKDWNPVPGMGHPRHGIQNPRLSWIPSHGATFLGPSANGNEQCRIQGRGPEGRAPLFFWPEGPRKFFFETAPPLFSRSG